MLPTALITGASAGFGAEFARQMAPWCGRLILVARRRDKLLELKSELLARHADLRIDCEVVDLQEPAEVEQLVHWLETEKLGIDWLINNAGLGDIGNVASAPWPRLHAMLQVNIWALSRLTSAVLPGMLQQGVGQIVNLGSIAGYLPIPGFAVYAATKNFVNSYSEALYWELKPRGVRVLAVCPGPVTTEFLTVATRAGMKKSFSAPSFMEIPCAEVVRQSLLAARKGRPRLVPGFFVWWGSAILQVLPLWWLRMLFRARVISSP